MDMQWHLKLLINIQVVKYIYFFSMYVFVCVPECTCVHHVYAVPEESEEGIGSPGIGIKGSCEPLCGC